MKPTEPSLNWLNRVEPIIRLFRKIPQHRWVFLCQALLVVFLAKQLALITWQLVPDEEPGNHWQVNQQVHRTSQTASHYNSLDRLYLFGEPPVKEKAQQVIPDQVPVSRLAAQISGIVSSSDPLRSLAIIKVGGSDKTYRIGETLKGTRAKVHEIYPDRVILANGNRFESLLMYPDEANVKPRPVARPQATSVKEAIARLRDNPASFTDIVRITPDRTNGELQGYRISPNQQPELFKALGLQPGDLAVAINGHDLTDQAEAMEVMTSLPKLNQITLTVERKGQQYQIDISS